MHTKSILQKVITHITESKPKGDISMVLKRSNDPVCKSPAGSMATKSLKDKAFMKPKKGSHSGAMGNSEKYFEMGKMPKGKKGYR